MGGHVNLAGHHDLGPAAPVLAGVAVAGWVGVGVESCHLNSESSASCFSTVRAWKMRSICMSWSERWTP